MAHSNYADKPTEGSGLTEHRLNLANDARAFTPDSGERDGEGTFSNLSLYSTGDWSWKPGRDNQLGYEPDPCHFQTFKGVPPSAAELYRGSLHQPG